MSLDLHNVSPYAVRHHLARRTLAGFASLFAVINPRVSVVVDPDADYKALRGDWETIGSDLYDAVEVVESEVGIEC